MKQEEFLKLEIPNQKKFLKEFLKLKTPKPEDFDFKYLMHHYYDSYKDKHKNDADYEEIHKETKKMFDECGVKLWHDYRTLDKCYKSQKYRFDCDSYNGTNDLMDEIYDLLWRNTEEWGVPLGNPQKFGGDTMNSFAITFNALMGKSDFKKSFDAYQASEKVDILEDYATYTGCLGNFTLVPKGYNGYRGISSTLQDYWDLSLNDLRRNRNEEDWLKNIDMSFDRYINTFFLWDYVDETYHVRPLFSGHGPLLDSKAWILPRRYEQRQVDEFEEFMTNVNIRIKRRGKFMAAMLKIASDSPKDWRKIITKLATDVRLGTMEQVVNGLKNMELQQSTIDSLEKIDLGEGAV